MIKKFLFLILCLLFFISSYGAQIFEIGGSIMTIAMTDYNNELEETMKKMEAIGAKIDYNLLNFAGAFNLCGIFPLSKEKGATAITMIIDYIIVENKNKVYWPNGQTYFITNENWSVNYTGMGVRKYFDDKITDEKVKPFIGCDLGAGIGFNNFLDFKAYYPSGALWDTGYAYMSGIFFGTRLETGINYFFADNFGIYFKIGGRYMKGQLTGIMKSTGVIFPKEEETKQNLDYSGFNISMGITFQIGSDKKEGDIKKQIDYVRNEPDLLPVLPEENPEYIEFVKKGDIEFGRNRYKIALTYYEEAIKIAESAELYKKIGNCNYYIGNKEAAKKAYKKSLELDPMDINLIEFLEKLK